MQLPLFFYGAQRCNRPTTATRLLVCFLSMIVSQCCADDIDFDTQIRPLLSEKCFPCHGPDPATRKADLRIDTAEGAFEDLGGYSAFFAHMPEKSEALIRVFSTDPDEIMPPPDSKLSLTDDQKDVLRKWVEGGAAWSEHWSFVPPTKPNMPRKTGKSSINPIDDFIAAKATEAGLQLSREADKAELLRRVTLDLTGLPPTLGEIDSFVNDESANAYEVVVDRLLASPHYGERMAWEWLDAARYADTDGFQGDPTRTMWPWRDWLVSALNDNQPFDQFTIEMLAGDLLDDATNDQILATAFNRNHMFNGEGGRIAEETRVENVFDRTETTGTVWLGLTMTCCRCHDHKYDPISQKDYFQLYAFFNNTSETGKSGRGKTAPILKYMPPMVSSNGEAKALAKPDAKQKEKPEDRAVTVMVMDRLPESKLRKTMVLDRGAYDKVKDIEVKADTPSILPPLPNNAPRNRLSLAKWIVSPKNPLTARVTVNRYWQTFFGKGLVKSTEDFGSQGNRPSHPALLDWLALEFIESGWNVKHIHKLMVMSSTYRQSSEVKKNAIETDPENRWLSYWPRRRLPSWALRDQALAISGLLNRKLGGEAVRPYQPNAIWAEATFGKIRYKQDEGDKLYRRSLYIFWRRIVGPTMFFDGAKRQTCEVKPTITNTPLHALTTLNETAFVEAARVLAEQVLLSHSDQQQRLESAFRMVTARQPTQQELSILSTRIDSLRLDFTDNPEDARQLLSVGHAARNQTLQLAEHAAYSVVCSTILNLDETLCR